MKHGIWLATLRSASVSLAVALFACSIFANGQGPLDSAESKTRINSPTADEMLKKVDSLVQQNEQLEKQNRELISVISAMRRMLDEQSHASKADATQRIIEPAVAKETRPDEGRHSPNEISSTTTPAIKSLQSSSSTQAGTAGQTTNVV